MGIPLPTLPLKHTDFIFAATTEELGFFAISLIILAYFFIIKTLIEKAYNTHNNLPCLSLLSALLSKSGLKPLSILA